VLHQQISAAYVGAVNDYRTQARLDLARALRANDDAEAQRLIAELGPSAVDELDALEDAGITVESFGVTK
jgi:hypothetical protein